MQRFRLVVLSAVWTVGFFYIVDRINISLAAPELIKEFGLTGTQMGTILSAYFWGFIPGTFLGGMACGYLDDRLKKRSLVGILFCILACPAMIGAMAAKSFLSTELLLITALFFSMGAINSIIVLVYDLYPIESFGTAIGIVVGLGGGLSGLMAPLLVGFLLDATGSFFWGFSILSLGTLAAGGCFAILLSPGGCPEDPEGGRGRRGGARNRRADGETLRSGWGKGLPAITGGSQPQRMRYNTLQTDPAVRPTAFSPGVS